MILYFYFKVLKNLWIRSNKSIKKLLKVLWFVWWLNDFYSFKWFKWKLSFERECIRMNRILLCEFCLFRRGCNRLRSLTCVSVGGFDTCSSRFLLVQSIFVVPFLPSIKLNSSLAPNAMTWTISCWFCCLMSNSKRCFWNIITRHWINAATGWLQQ